MKHLLTLLFTLAMILPGLAGEISFTLDFQNPAFQKAVKSCPFARVEADTLVFDVPKTSHGSMLQIPIEALCPGFQDAMKGFYVCTEVDVTFADIPEGKVGYHGGKFQFHLLGAKGNPWPGLLNIHQSAWGSLDWTHSRAVVYYEPQVTDATIEFGIQEGNGHIAYKNIRFTRGQKGPTSIFSLEKIPQAEYSARMPHRMRGVMSPNTASGPREQDFADLEKWGANLIRWQMGFGKLKDAEEARKLLWDRFPQIDEVLRLAAKYHLSVVLDVHTMSGSRPVILGTPEGRDVLVEFWEEVARRYKGNPNIFGYNLMNEPVSRDIEPGGPTLNEQYFRLIKTIRAIDPETPIILDSDSAGVIGQLEFMEVFPFKNVIYSPHFYLPFELTHQLNQNQSEYLPYPNEARGWNKEFLREQMEVARQFQLKTGARIYIGEFSCIRWAPGSEQFIADCIDLFEEYGWDWSFHAFREWQGWSVEHEGKPAQPQNVEMTPRKKVLLKGFERNKSH